MYSGLMCKSFTDSKTERDMDLDDLTDPANFDFKSKFKDERVNKEMRIILKLLDKEGALDGRE